MSFFIRKKCCIVLCIIIECCTNRLLAQNQLTLSAIADSAVNHLPVIKQRQSNIDIAQADLVVTRHSFLPQLKISEQINVGTDNSLAGSYFTFGITPSTSAGVRSENNTALESGNAAVLYSEYELYNFGLNAAKVNSARSVIDMQQADLEKEKYLLELQVARLYFSMLAAQYRLTADLQNIYRYDSIFRMSRALATSGIKPGADSSLAKAELSKARVNYNKSLGNSLRLKDELSYLTGLSSSKLELDTSNLDPDEHLLKADSLLIQVSNPLINYYVARKNTFLANEQVIKKSYLPKILLAAGAWMRGSSIQYNDQYKSLPYGWGYQRFNYLAGIALTYNLFNGLIKKDQLVANRFRFIESDYGLQQQTLAVELAFHKADHTLQTAYANYLEIPVQLQSAGETYRQKLAQYKAGLISLIDLINASFVLYRSQIDYAEGLTDLFQAKLEKAVASGELYSFIQTFK